MLGIGRRRTQGQLAKAELNQGIGHLRQAATHVAKGAGATVGPRVQAARSAVAPTAILVRNRASRGIASTVAALAPLVLAMRDAQGEATGKAAIGRRAAASRKAKAKIMKATKKKRTMSRGMTTALLAAGTIAGLAGAAAIRRHREQGEWIEYDPAGTLDPMREDVDTIVVQTPDPTAKVTQAGPTGASGSAVAGNGGASTAKASSQPVIQPTAKASGRR